MAFIGLTLLSGVTKIWEVPVRELFGDSLQIATYRATLSRNRFEDICTMLRFEDISTRAERLKEDYSAEI